MEDLRHAGKILALIAATLGFIFLSSLKFCSGNKNATHNEDIDVMPTMHASDTADVR